MTQGPIAKIGVVLGAVLATLSDPDRPSEDRCTKCGAVLLRRGETITVMPGVDPDSVNRCRVDGSRHPEGR